MLFVTQQFIYWFDMSDAISVHLKQNKKEKWVLDIM